MKNSVKSILFSSTNSMDQNWRNFLVARVDFEIMESLLAIRLEEKKKKIKWNKKKKIRKKME